jgi:hypothetical protein
MRLKSSSPTLAATAGPVLIDFRARERAEDGCGQHPFGRALERKATTDEPPAMWSSAQETKGSRAGEVADQRGPGGEPGRERPAQPRGDDGGARRARGIVAGEQVRVSGDWHQALEYMGGAVRARGSVADRERTQGGGAPRSSWPGATTCVNLTRTLLSDRARQRGTQTRSRPNGSRARPSLTRCCRGRSSAQPTSARTPRRSC